MHANRGSRLQSAIVFELTLKSIHIDAMLCAFLYQRGESHCFELACMTRVDPSCTTLPSSCFPITFQLSCRGDLTTTTMNPSLHAMNSLLDIFGLPLRSRANWQDTSDTGPRGQSGGSTGGKRLI